MFTFNLLLPRHRRYARLADAFVDGELGGGDLRRFEAHLPTCARCQAAVASARTLKTSISALPELTPPRSFRLTQAMVATPATTRQKATTPLYLGLARAGAALSGGAFATVLAVSAFDSNSQQSADGDAAGGAREIMLTEAAADDSSAFNASGGDVTKSAPESVATATPQPQIPQPTSGGVSGAAASPSAVPSPMPPTSGVDPNATPPEDSQRSTALDTSAGTPLAGGVAIEPVPGANGVTSFEPVSVPAEDDDGFGAWTITLGAIAAVAVGGLALLEISRRRAK
jgi:anti-sigma factor RsiW